MDENENARASVEARMDRIGLENSYKRATGEDEVVDGERTVGDLRREGRSDSGEGMKTRQTYRR